MQTVHVAPAAPATIRRRPSLVGVGRVLDALRARLGALFALLVALNAADLVTTRLVLDRGGAEANPLLEPVVASVLGAVALKAMCLAIIGLLLARCRRTTRVVALLVAVDVWYAFVVLWNVRVLAHLA